MCISLIMAVMLLRACHLFDGSSFSTRVASLCRRHGTKTMLTCLLQSCQPSSLTRQYSSKIVLLRALTFPKVWYT